MCPIGAAHSSLSNPFQPWVGGTIQSGRTLARHRLLSLAIQLYIFLALPETMPCHSSLGPQRRKLRATTLVQGRFKAWYGCKLALLAL